MRNKGVQYGDPSCQWPLTFREAEVMDALVKFGDTKSVARELGFAIKTAEVHFSRIFKKMGLYGGGARVLAALKWYEYRRSNGATAG